MKKLRFGATLHFLIVIGHACCLFALDEAFEAYGIKDFMHQMVSGHIWMLYALTIGIAFVFCVAGLYALSATGLGLIWGGERPKSFCILYSQRRK